MIIKENGDKLDTSKSEALEMAIKSDLDLVQVGEKGDTAVCKILDFNKMMYDAEKARKKSNKASKTDIKELRIGWRISDNDLETKLKSCRKMVVKEENKVKITTRFKGREMKFMNTEGIKLMSKVRNKVSEFASCSNIKIDGNNIIMMVEPIKSK